MKFFDGDDAGSSNEGGWPLTRRVALAGTAAGAFALAGAGLMGCSATDPLSCYVRFATSRAGITSRQIPRDRVQAR